MEPPKIENQGTPKSLPTMNFQIPPLTTPKKQVEEEVEEEEQEQEVGEVNQSSNSNPKSKSKSVTAVRSFFQSSGSFFWCLFQDHILPNLPKPSYFWYHAAYISFMALLGGLIIWAQE
jgi:hypothetical protein